MPHNSNMTAHISTPKPPFIPNNPPVPPPEKQFLAIIAQPTDKKGNDMIMIASLSDAPGIKVEYDDPIDIPLINRGPHTWLIDSATTSHLSGDISLFHTIERINPVTIKTASGESFTANQCGTVRIVINSDTRFRLPNVPVTLLDVIYIPKLRANLLSIGHMTNLNVDVIFSKTQSSLSHYSSIIARGPKKGKIGRASCRERV